MVAEVRWSRRVADLGLALSLVLAVGCSSAAAPRDRGPAAGEPADPAEADRTVAVLARDDLSFDPVTLDVAVGEVVTFEVTNRGAIAHEFVLGDQSVQERHGAEMRHGTSPSGDQEHVVVLPPGRTEQVTWRFTRAGEMRAACHLPGHYDAGMYVDIRVRGGELTENGLEPQRRPPDRG